MSVNYVEVTCDRCTLTVSGLEEVVDGRVVATSGFYRREGWARYMDEGEQIICDGCMWADDDYLAEHPGMHR